MADGARRTTNGPRHGPGRNPGPVPQAVVMTPYRRAAVPERRRIAVPPVVPEGPGQSRVSASTGFGIMRDVAKAAARMTTPVIMPAV